MKIEGEKILCIFRKMSGPYVIAGTTFADRSAFFGRSGRHRTQRATIEGLPAICIVKKEWKYKGCAGKN